MIPQDKVIAMAREAGLQDVKFSSALQRLRDAQLYRFTELAVAYEREECAKVCERSIQRRFHEYGTTEVDTGAQYYPGSSAEVYVAMDEEADDCAKAIRARSEK